ncbi:MAG: hypothetical protein AB7O45_15730, partial [Alphaproteobacteria bacterium]
MTGAGPGLPAAAPDVAATQGVPGAPLAHPTGTMGRVLWRDPLIVTGSTAGRRLPVGPAPVLSPAIGDRPAWFLVRLTWEVETPWRLERLVAAHDRQRAAHPHHRLIVLANTGREHELLARAGVAT